MFARKFADLSRYWMLPFLLIVFGTITLVMRGSPFAKMFPYYHSFIMLFTLISLERIYSYSRRVSQRHMIWRDLASTAVQTFLAGATLGLIVLPVLHYFPNTFLGRRFLFGLSDQLGPLWVQVVAVYLLNSCCQYWIHRWDEHQCISLWKLHSYHHSVTHLQMSNVLVSNPFEWSLRNVLAGLMRWALSGFNPYAYNGVGGRLQSLRRLFPLRRRHAGRLARLSISTRRRCIAGTIPSNSRIRSQVPVKWLQLRRRRSGASGILFSAPSSLAKDEKGNVLEPLAILGHPEGYPDEPNYLKILCSGCRGLLSALELAGLSAVPIKSFLCPRRIGRFKKPE